METCGIIAEYNPFHNGHKYQVGEIRRQLGNNTGIIAAMSGNFVQRGGPAITDKWQRAAWATRNGVDLIIELPVTTATASAERFGAGGVRLLDALGIVRHIAFGAETDRLARLSAIADLQVNQPSAYKTALDHELKANVGYAAARSTAIGNMLGQDAGLLLQQSNAILAVSYLLAIKKYKSSLVPLLIERKGPHEHADYDDGHHASASYIRKILLNAFRTHKPADALQLSPLLPTDVLADLLQAGITNKLISFETLFPFSLSRLLTTSKEEQLAIPSLRPDLAMRLSNCAADRIGPNDAARFVATAATRAYPASRVQRALTDLFLGSSFVDSTHDGPALISVLAFSRRGRYLLRLMKKHAHLPVVTRSSDVFELSGKTRLELERNQKAADLYALLQGQPTRADFDHKVTIV